LKNGTNYRTDPSLHNTDNNEPTMTTIFLVSFLLRIHSGFLELE